VDVKRKSTKKAVFPGFFEGYAAEMPIWRGFGDFWR